MKQATQVQADAPVSRVERKREQPLCLALRGLAEAEHEFIITLPYAAPTEADVEVKKQNAIDS